MSTPTCDEYDETLGPALIGGGFSAAQADALCATIYSAGSDVSDSVDGLKYGVNSAWLVLAGALVMFMHGGFAMLCAGAIRSKNTLNILLQTILDLCVSAICFYCVGFGFAYGEGDNPNPFIGDALFGMARWSTKYTGVGDGRWTDWFYQWAFATTATTIPAGAVAERFNFNAYLAYTIFVSAFIYPVVVHWVWSREGWATHFAPPGAENGKQPEDMLFHAGAIDFAGCGVVHMVGGLTGLMGAWLVGPRLGRFDSAGQPVDMPGHSATLVVLGTVILWFGWYGFNPGSVLIVDNETSGKVAGRVAVCTTLSAAAGGVACLLNSFRRAKAWDLVCLCNGVLCGLVSITASAHVVEPWAAIIAGFLGGLIFDGLCWVFLKLRIDDPLSAAPMHAGCGMWGLIMVGILAKQEYVKETYVGLDDTIYQRGDFYGLFYGGGGRLLACEVVLILAIIAWVCGLSGILFTILKFTKNLRISEEEEHRGLDASKHGGSAYNTDNVGRQQGPGQAQLMK